MDSKEMICQMRHAGLRMIILLLCIVLLCITYSVAAYSKNEQALPVIDENPLLRIFGLPKPQTAIVTASNNLELDLSVSINNSSVQEQNTDEEIIWDAESSIYEIGIRYGLEPGVALGIEIPFVKHSGGVLDSVIQRTHKIIGLSNTRQQQFDKNKIQILYKKNGSTQIDLGRSVQGLGDIRFIASWQLEKYSNTGRRDLSFSAMLKIPTGKSSLLLGSGGTDISMTLTYHNPTNLAQYNSGLLVNLGVLRMGKSEVLSNLQKEYVNFANFTFIWHFNQQINIKSQLDYHSSFYNSKLRQLGSTSIKLDVGANVKLSRGHHIEFGMTQNLITDTTPDLGLFCVIGMPIKD